MQWRKSVKMLEVSNDSGVCRVSAMAAADRSRFVKSACHWRHFWRTGRRLWGLALMQKRGEYISCLHVREVASSNCMSYVEKCSVCRCRACNMWVVCTAACRIVGQMSILLRWGIGRWGIVCS